MTSPRLLFLVGVGRSGTTALADLFSAHPAIGVGMERFKFFYKDPDWELTPDRFTRERFFDFTDGGTNIRPDVSPRWREYYDPLEAKWDDLSYVGDKASVVHLPRLLESLPEAQIVCIVRDIRSTAASWAARAANPKDEKWPERRGARASVAPWNRALTSISESRAAHPDRVCIVEYERLYGDPDAVSLRRVVERLGLPWAPELEETFGRLHDRYVTSIRTKDRTLSPEAERSIARRADFEAWDEVVGQAL